MTQLAVIEESPLPSVLVGSATEKLVMAGAIATALAPVIKERHLYATISGKRHVLYEGWTTLGALLGVFPVTVWTRRTDDGWEARVEARTLAGAIVGAAESECTRAEAQWSKREDYALRSMAQTRAGSKALRMPLGFVMQLAGFEATPAEEMPKDEAEPVWAPSPPSDAPLCEQCEKQMTWRYGVKDGQRWMAFMCPDYRRTKHRSVFIRPDEEEEVMGGND